MMPNQEEFQNLVELLTKNTEKTLELLRELEKQQEEKLELLRKISGLGEVGQKKKGKVLLG